MSRLNKFKEERNHKNRYRFLFFSFFFILIVGMCVVDYSTNYLVKNQKSLQIVSLNRQDPKIEFNLLNHTFVIDMSFINNDMHKVKQWLSGFKRIRNGE